MIATLSDVTLILFLEKKSEKNFIATAPGKQLMSRNGQIEKIVKFNHNDSSVAFDLCERGCTISQFRSISIDYKHLTDFVEIELNFMNYFRKTFKPTFDFVICCICTPW